MATIIQTLEADEHQTTGKGPALTEPLQESLSAILEKLASVDGGDVASYIPELAKADPNKMAIAVATLDGEVHAVGDAAQEYTIQSVSKPFAYAAALDRLGRKEMLKRVGVDPTGEAFNSIVLDDVNRRPFNPMVNAGAIAISALFSGSTLQHRSEAMLWALSRFAGRPLSVDEAVFQSEASTGFRNRAIAYLMLNAGMLEVDPDAALDTYFRQCSVLVNTRDLALMAATLANSGINPKTRERAVLAETVADTLTVMLTCGMYDYAGQWAFEVGVPAKSGVSGAVIAVIPGQFGVAAFSPRLDRFGNSVRAVAACRDLSMMFSLHSYRQRIAGNGQRLREWTGRDLRSQRWRPARHRKVLDTEGDRILAIETRGDLSLATTERILRRAGTALAEGRIVILNAKNLTGFDAGSARLLVEFSRTLETEGRSLRITQPLEGGVVSRLVRADGRIPLSYVIETSLDQALENAEEDLLAIVGVLTSDEALPLESATLFSGLSHDQVSRLMAATQPEERSYAANETVVRQGDPSDAIFMVASGSVTVQLPAESGPPTRVTSFGPGAIFGEMGLIDGRPRSADVVAEIDTVCWAIPIEPLRAFLAANAAIMNSVLGNLVVDLSDRLRQSNRMVTSLR